MWTMTTLIHNSSDAQDSCESAQLFADAFSPAQNFSMIKFFILKN